MDYPSPAPKHWSRRKRLSLKMVIVCCAFILLAGLLIRISAITHEFGPYMGKVVDLETGAPLEGAAVLISFQTDGFEGSGSYAGAVETLTDVHGEFKLPETRVFVFHPLNKWNSNGYVTIFKPGYGAYPGHKKALPRFEIGGALPEKQYVIFKLPELKTLDERKKNLFNVSLWADIPVKKVKNILKLRSQEYVDLGFSPLPSSRYGE